jgi:hypothetical protein
VRALELRSCGAALRGESDIGRPNPLNSMPRTLARPDDRARCCSSVMDSVCQTAVGANPLAQTRRQVHRSRFSRVLKNRPGESESEARAFQRECAKMRPVSDHGLEEPKSRRGLQAVAKAVG